MSLPPTAAGDTGRIAIRASHDTGAILVSGGTSSEGGSEIVTGHIVIVIVIVGEDMIEKNQMGATTARSGNGVEVDHRIGISELESMARASVIKFSYCLVPHRLLP